MKREQLEHILRAAAQIINQKDLLVIGSQSVLASWDETKLPPEAVRSIEADVAPLDGDDEKSDLIDGSVGEGSQFHETFGIYAQGVSLKTAVLPEGWRDRLVKLDTRPPTRAAGCVWSRTTAFSWRTRPEPPSRIGCELTIQQRPTHATR